MFAELPELTPCSRSGSRRTRQRYRLSFDARLAPGSDSVPAKKNPPPGRQRVQCDLDPLGGGEARDRSGEPSQGLQRWKIRPLSSLMDGAPAHSIPIGSDPIPKAPALLAADNLVATAPRRTDRDRCWRVSTGAPPLAAISHRLSELDTNRLGPIGRTGQLCLKGYALTRR